MKNTSNTPATAAHTPTPWQVEPCIWPGYPFRISGPGETDFGSAGMFSPALIFGDGTHNRGTAAANAAFIVFACNSHAALVDAVQSMVNITTHPKATRADCLTIAEGARAVLAQIKA